jgi:hypothetical protein
MTRARGNALQNALARYLTGWWPHAESAGAGRNGTDVLGTPGVVWECKTASDFKRDFRPTAWVAQSLEHANRAASHDMRASIWPEGEYPPLPVSVTVYFPPGIGERGTAHALTIMPMHVLMRLPGEAGYTPAHNEAQRSTNA